MPDKTHIEKAALAILPLLDEILDHRSWERATPPYPEAWIYHGNRNNDLRAHRDALQSALSTTLEPSEEEYTAALRAWRETGSINAVLVAAARVRLGE